MPTLTATATIAALQGYADPSRTAVLQRFFKTGEGEYGYGDVFIGLTVPQTRSVAKEFKQLPLGELQKLIENEIHEYRLCALLILVLQYSKATPDEQLAMYKFYLSNLAANHINNWDLIDTSAEYIVGPYLSGKPRDILFELAKSDNLWERRASIMSAFHYIKQGEPGTTLELAEVLLHDEHDLIQKAVGWQLREVGKRCDEGLLLDFLDRHAKQMPRTALRYSIERLTPEKRSHYMAR